MKIRKLNDRRKEFLATAVVSLIVVSVSVYVVYLVNGLTQKVYRVFGRSADQAGAFVHFDFARFEELGLRPRLTTSVPATTTSIVPAAPVTTTPSTSSASSSSPLATSSPASSS